MIYVEMLGRMGNQMFSYAHARYIQYLYPEQKIAADFKNFDPQDETWMNYLQYFKCSGNVVEEKRKLNLIQRGVLHFYFKLHGEWKGWKEISEHEKKWANFLSWFDLYIFTCGYYKFKYRKIFKNKLLLGFFESDKYFSEIRNILKSDFTINDIETNKFVNDLFSRLNPANAICVGIRKGDFASASNKDFCDICSPDYYISGVNLVKSLALSKENANIKKICIFTDDVEWAEENVRFDLDVEYVTSSIHGKIKPWEMLQAMSGFKYYVIPNSSFFWWGQFLSKYDEPIVVAPSRWRGRDSEIFKDTYQDNWLLLNPDGSQVDL